MYFMKSVRTILIKWTFGLRFVNNSKTCLKPTLNKSETCLNQAHLKVPSYQSQYGSIMYKWKPSETTNHFKPKGGLVYTGFKISMKLPNKFWLTLNCKLLHGVPIIYSFMNLTQCNVLLFLFNPHQTLIFISSHLSQINWKLS